MNSNSPIYHLRSSGSAHGDVFTRHEVVAYMLDAVGYTSQKDLSGIRILEPSCGYGEFVVEILARLKESSARYGFDFNEACHQCVSAYDIDPVKVGGCIRRIEALFPELSDIGHQIKCEDFLLSAPSSVDIVVGNPPYIRYEEIPVGKRELYKSLFSTFYYRTDIYVLFFEKTIRLLKPNGQHSFICANRWMKNQYGKKLRRMVASGLRICRIVDMERTHAFHEDVLAYPAITVFEKSSSAKYFEFASAESVSELGRLRYSILSAPSDEDWSCAFSTSVRMGGLTSIERQGFKIGIGVATGADSIFVSSALPGMVEEELLLPALNAWNLSGDIFSWDGRYLLNPYRTDGTLICLDDFPLAKAYLERNHDKLARRYKAVKNPSRWYATIDPIRRALLDSPKIMLPDISGNRFLFVDKGQYYPLHNLYYITGQDECSLRLLAAILMSDFIKSQLDSLSNHMNGGYVRWQSQYLKQLRVPQLSALSERIVSDLLGAYGRCDYGSINRIVENIVADTPHIYRMAVSM